MKLVFVGHEERYAVEQTLFHLFPSERPVYDGEDENVATVTLRRGRRRAEARTRIRYHGKTEEAACRVSLADCAGDDYRELGEIRRILKLSFYRAGVRFLDHAPPWGALTGVRPDKLAKRFLREGKTLAETDRILARIYDVSAPRRRLCLETSSVGLAAEQGLGPLDFSLYAGIPFCPTRCAYCSFVAESVERAFPLVEPYLDALHREIDLCAETVRSLGLRLKTFYMGGGTPTTLSALQMDELLAHLREAFSFPPGMECTVEAGRPDTITREKTEVLRRHGVTRVSVNPQSMEQSVLDAIGRKHTPADILRAMDIVREAGFSHINMDLIAGLPADTPDGFRRTLDTVLRLGADNITVHTLALKRGSRLTQEGGGLPSAEAVGEMLSYAERTLREHGYAPYYLYRQKQMSGNFENIGWCLPHTENLYNIYIMEELMTVLSLGAGGSIKTVSPTGEIARVFNCKYPKEYIERQEKIRENLLAVRRFYEERLPHIFQA